MTAPTKASSAQAAPAATRGEGADVAVRPYRSPARFLDLQRRFYRGDPHFVPALPAGEAWQIDPKKNPFFAHAEAGFFVAWRGAEPVGRISVARDRLHDDFHGDRVGFFGHFEATDGAAADALLRTAATWLRQRGATELRGPVDLSTNYRCGLLVDGEPGPPVMAMPHNPRVYADWLEAFGLHKAKDLLALRLLGSSMDHDRLERIVSRLQQKSGVQLRRVDLRRFDRELAVLWDLYHRIWEKNWGFSPMTRPEFEAQAKDLKKVAHPSLMHIAELDGAPVGFGIALPDVNVAIKACGGRLWPIGWWKFLRALRNTKAVRTITLGVLPEHRKKGIEIQLLTAITRQGMAAGFDSCEASWILEDNRDMLGPLETIGASTYRRYRIYTRQLS